MTKRTRNTITIFFLGLFGLHLVAPLLLQGCITYVKYVQRKTISENVHHPDLFEKIILDEKEFSALVIKENDEFIFNDILYDIYSIKKEKNHYIILALSDERETKFEKIHQQETSKELKEFNIKIKQFYFQLLYIEKVFHLSFREANNQGKFLRIKINMTTPPYLKIPTPPPVFVNSVKCFSSGIINQLNL